jgi:hypothetical protein
VSTLNKSLAVPKDTEDMMTASTKMLLAQCSDYDTQTLADGKTYTRIKTTLMFHESQQPDVYIVAISQTFTLFLIFILSLQLYQ